MTKFARIENEKVVEIFEGAKLPEFHPSLVWVQSPDYVDESYTYVNGAFSAPTVSIDDLKADKIAALKKLHDEKINAGLVYDGHLYQIDVAARQNMNDVYTKLADGQTNPHGGVWRNTANQMIPMDDTTVKTFINSVFAYRFGLMNTLWTHNDNISAMTRSEDVKSYDIETGWPNNE